MCLKGLKWKGVIISAVLFLVVAEIVHIGSSFASMGYYTDPAYSGLWSKIIMPGPGAPPAEFFYLSIAFSLISALIYIIVYAKLKPAIPGKTAVKMGLSYGFWVLFLLAVVPGSLSMYLLLNLPAALIAVWAVENLVIALIGGILIAKFN